ncbi:MAG: gamma-glutamyltransferase [Gemmatimonadota bacterium]|nr:gamma-glutamyltransferase [Gemmatimonadota bacterium]
MNRTLLAVTLGAAVAAGCAKGPPPAKRPAGFPADWTVGQHDSATSARHAMIASNSALASQAGVDILKQGGNAVDAAVATGFAMAVTYPQAGNIGGGGFMVIHMADGRSAALDYREVAPLAATRNMYLDAKGNLTDKSRIGALSVGVPGAVAGLAEALKKYGTMSLHDVMQPAIHLARDGFMVDTALSRAIQAGAKLIGPYEGDSLFLPNGTAVPPGTKLVQPQLARTLEAIADSGPAMFYKGWIADSLVAEMHRDHGIITKQDLAKYAPEWRDPIAETYRGYTVYSMPPSSSGGVIEAEILNILETFPTLPPYGSTMYFHDVAEAFRRAFIDRNTELGDPAFVKNPIDRLTSKAYARTLRDSILPDRASKTPTFAELTHEGTNTTHYSVVDSAGDAVSTTTTLNSLFGSGNYVGGAGFFLNNEMDDFASKPGSPNQFGLVQGEANAIAPGKRMLSAMAPSIVTDSAGKVLLVAGAAGGPTIITATTQIILNVIDSHMSLADAMSAPRIHQQAWPDKLIYEKGGLMPAVADSLKAMGYDLSEVGHLATANAVLRVAGGWEGMVEPRATGGARGY